MLDIELLYFAACPNYKLAHEMLKQILDAEGISAEIRLVAVETDEEAVRHRFYGSPTVRINGDDVVPPVSGSTPALACRVYQYPQGGFAPVPPARVILEALRRATAR
ncbi:MAG TPA: hypothetical protein VF807_12710 [Ktedonobacterales bacterium]